MLALRGGTQKQDVSVPNILPCRIHSSGPAQVTKRFWSPAQENGRQRLSSFFRTFAKTEAYCSQMARKHPILEVEGCAGRH
jgi:hypothetical protein